VNTHSICKGKNLLYMASLVYDRAFLTKTAARSSICVHGVYLYTAT
jgi:hypothetical protein